MDERKFHPQSQERLLTVQSAAELLAVGRSTIYRLMNSGELLSVKVRGATRITQSELERYMRSLKEER